MNAQKTKYKVSISTKRGGYIPTDDTLDTDSNTPDDVYLAVIAKVNQFAGNWYGLKTVEYFQIEVDFDDNRFVAGPDGEILKLSPAK